MSFLIRLFVNLFHSDNGSHRIISFCSSNNHSGIIQSCLSLFKYSIVFLKIFLKKPGYKNFLVIRFTSKLKLLANLLAQRNSPIMALHLYLVGISSQVLTTIPLKCGLHQNFTDRNKFVMRKVAIEIEALASSDHYVKQSNKEGFDECLLSCTNIITRNIYTGKDETFISLQKLTNIINKDSHTISRQKILHSNIKQK